MKHAKYLLITFFVLCSLASCNNKGGKESTTFTKEDTLKVIEKSNEYLQLVKQGEFDDAIEMVYGNDLFKDDNTKKKIENLRVHLETFPILSYEITDIKYRNNQKTLVYYTMEFRKDKKLNAVILFERKDNEWKIKDGSYTGN